MNYPRIALGIAATWFLAGVSYADTYSVKSGTLTYTIDHLLKTAEGTSHEVKGKIVCEKERKNCEFLVAVPGKSFDSENSNRDAHMRETIKEAAFPIITVSGKVSQLQPQMESVPAQVTLAGKSVSYVVKKMNLQNEKSGFSIQGEIIVLLSQHEIERPSLLGASIKDEIPIKFQLEFTQ